MIAPATTSNCGAALAIMPGIALPRKPRISLIEGDAQRRCDAAAPAQHQDRTSCSSPAMPTVAAITSAA